MMFDLLSSYTDADLFSCYTFNTRELVMYGRQLNLLLYLSSSGKPYNYSDVLDIQAAGAYLQVSIDHV